MAPNQYQFTLAPKMIEYLGYGNKFVFPVNMQYVFHQFGSDVCVYGSNKFLLITTMCTSIFVSKSIIFYARYIVGAEILLHMFVCVNNLSYLMANGIKYFTIMVPV